MPAWQAGTLEQATGNTAQLPDTSIDAFPQPSAVYACQHAAPAELLHDQHPLLTTLPGARAGPSVHEQSTDDNAHHHLAPATAHAPVHGRMT